MGMILTYFKQQEHIWMFPSLAVSTNKKDLKILEATFDQGLKWKPQSPSKSTMQRQQVTGAWWLQHGDDVCYERCKSNSKVLHDISWWSEKLYNVGIWFTSETRVCMDPQSLQINCYSFAFLCAPFGLSGEHCSSRVGHRQWQQNCRSKHHQGSSSQEIPLKHLPSFTMKWHPLWDFVGHIYKIHTFHQGDASQSPSLLLLTTPNKNRSPPTNHNKTHRSYRSPAPKNSQAFPISSSGLRFFFCVRPRCSAAGSWRRRRCGSRWAWSRHPVPPRHSGETWWWWSWLVVAVGHDMLRDDVWPTGGELESIHIDSWWFL